MRRCRPRARHRARRGAAGAGARVAQRCSGGVATVQLADFGVVIECSGSAAGIAFALEATARGGRLVQIGLAGRPSRSIDTVCYRELTVTSGNASTPQSWRHALELIEGATSSVLKPLRARKSSRWRTGSARVRGDARGLGHQVRARPVHIEPRPLGTLSIAAERVSAMANVRRTSMNLDFKLVERAQGGPRAERHDGDSAPSSRGNLET